MTLSLTEALKNQKKSTPRKQLQISGTLGIPFGGQKTVEVAGRKSFVYVKLRDNQSEVIQAFNNKVAPSYGLPVIVEWHSNRYVVVNVDTVRYQNNWNSFAPFLPRHGNTHSFDPDSSGGGDVVWVHSRQMMPALIIPSGSAGGPNVLLSSYTLKNADGTWKYVGNTGTLSLLPYKPSSSSGAQMALVYLDSVSGNPYFIIGSGTFMQSTITGSAQVLPYVPSLSNPNYIPLAAVRLVTGTSFIGWDNIYDVRQWLHTVPTGTSSGGSGGTGTGTILVQDEGTPLGGNPFHTLNFVGEGISAVDFVSTPGVVNIFVTGSNAPVNITGSPVGPDSRVVGTIGIPGKLWAILDIGWGTQGSRDFIRFGMNATGTESNAGKMGYQLFDNYLDIVGAGSEASSRTVKIYDNLIVSENISAGSYTLPGIVNNLIFADSNGTFTGAESYNASGTYGRKDKTWASVIPEDGWVFVSEAWTRTGNYTFTVSGDLTSRYRKGTKVKYNDPALEYGVVYSSSHAAGTTTVTLFTNDDFAMANTTITGRYISYIENPEGYPDWFNYTPTYGATAPMTISASSTTFAKFKVSDRTVFVDVAAVVTTATAASATVTASGPCAVGDGNNHLLVCNVRDAGAGSQTVGTGFISSSTINFRRFDAANWSLGASRVISASGPYPF